MKRAVLFVSICILSGASLRATALITVSPSIQSALVGSMAEVQVAISGLGHNSAPSVGAYDLNIAFDPAILSFTGITFGDQLDLSGSGSIQDFSPSAGLLEFYEISLDSAALLDAQQSDNFVLVTLQFKATAPGVSLLVPTINSISDSQSAPLSAELKSAVIDAVAVPEPASVWIIALATAGLASRRNPFATRHAKL